MQWVKRTFASLLACAALITPIAVAQTVNPSGDEAEAPGHDEDPGSRFDVEPDSSDAADDADSERADSTADLDVGLTASNDDDASEPADDAMDEQQDASDDDADETDDTSDQIETSDDDGKDRSDDASDDANDEDTKADDDDDKDDDKADDRSDDDGKTDRVEAQSAGSDTDGHGERSVIGTRDPVEYDREGYAAAAHEVLALSDDEADRDMLHALGFAVKHVEKLPGIELELLRISVPADRSNEVALAQLASRNNRSIYALNHVFAAGRMTKGPAGRKRTQATLHPGAAVGLIDGGVARTALPTDVKLETASFTTGPGAANDHGSAVASLLADAGVSHIYAANVFDGRNASAVAMVRALDWMAGNRVPVINISLAGPPNPIVHRIIEILRSRGHVIVAAVGNGGPAAPPLYPGAYPAVIGVTAVDASGVVYRRANRGPQTMFAADGVGVVAADERGALRTVSGTSFAAPMVSARLAKLISSLNAQASARAVSVLISSARDLGSPGRDPIYGYGWVGPGQ